MSRVWAINLGCGNQPYRGFYGLDWSGYAVDIRGDLAHLPFRDNSIDEFFASHCVEHIPYWQVVDVLREIYRCLKPKTGLFWGFVPDGVAVAQRWLESVAQNDKFSKIAWEGNIYGGNTTSKWSGPGQIHYCLYDPQLLYDVLIEGGFHPVQIFSQNPGPYDYRLTFACGKGVYPPGDIWATQGYPAMPWRKAIWEIEGSSVTPPPPTEEIIRG